MLLLGVLVLPFAVAAVVVAVCVGAWRALSPAERPSSTWLLVLIAVVLIDAFLVLVFAFAVVVFNCHGGYECPF